MGKAARNRCAALALLAHTASPGTGAAQEWLDDWQDKLAFESPNGAVRGQGEISAEVTGFYSERPPHGLLFSDQSWFLAPRLSAALNVQLGERITARMLGRADRGFDPGAQDGGEARLDEYFAQLDITAARDLRLRAGRFATVFGMWPTRHLPWENPLISSPMLFDDALIITDKSAPAGVGEFLARRDVADLKRDWLPVVWGPSYATGLALMGSFAGAEFALEAKNAALSSRPETWDMLDGDATALSTVSARLGLRPSEEWTVGVSHSRGRYLQDVAAASLPSGTDVDDFSQRSVGIDMAYAHRSLQLWSEWVRSSFDVPRVGRVGVTAGYVELKYALGQGWWSALRWNQTWFGKTPGSDARWDRTAYAIDLGVGYRFSRHIQGKIQISQREKSGFDPQGRQQAALQLTVQF